MENLIACPICKKNDTKHFLSAEDHLVSHQEFSLTSCNPCGFVYTSPRPSEQEIGKYYQSADYVSHNDTEQGFINSLYQLVKSITLKQKYRLLQSNIKKEPFSLLDYGCGTGSFAGFVAQKGHRVFGVEPDKGARSLASVKVKNVFADLHSLPEVEVFSIISMWHVLEHVHQLDETLRTLTKKLEPGGMMIIALPNRLSYDAIALGKYWAAYDLPRHLYHFSKKDICTLLHQHGMDFVKTKPMWFDAFYVGMLSYRNKKVSFPVIRGFWLGFKSNLRALFTGECSSMIYLFKKPG